jgi:hypothetical protein
MMSFPVSDDAVRTKTVRFQVPIENPVPVVDAAGRPLGSAVVSYTDDGFVAEVHLDKNRPETFDLEVNPDRARVSVRGKLEGTLLLLITIDT